MYCYFEISLFIIPMVIVVFFDCFYYFLSFLPIDGMQSAGYIVSHCKCGPTSGGGSMKGSEVRIRHRGRNYQTRLANCGRISYAAHDDLWHYHPFYHLILLSEGRHYLDLGEHRSVLLEKNSLFLLNPLQRHRFRHLPGEDFEHTAMIWRLVDSSGRTACFPLQELMRVPTEECTSFQVCQLNEPEVYRLQERHQRLLETMRENSQQQWWDIAFFHTWYSFLEMLMDKRGEAWRDLQHRMIGEVELLICRHFADPSFSRREIAERMGRSVNHLDGVFRSRCGCSLTGALRRKRLLHAVQLLLNTDRPIGEVAECCGFSSQSVFTRVFQREYGISPLHYRLKRYNRAGHFSVERQTVDSPATARGNSLTSSADH